ncbi:hypothetical protein KAR91_34535 [Candidatus Pacearchaeota archaeon]|nr:hypothetical protein [Candidatus Pacearchaeota archaeon]
MKTMAILFILAMASPCFGADVYEAVTPDNTVSAIGQVVVERTETETTESHGNFSLDQIDEQIAELQAIRAKVQSEAKKVKLKVEIIE